MKLSQKVKLCFQLNTLNLSAKKKKNQNIPNSCNALLNVASVSVYIFYVLFLFCFFKPQVLPKTRVSF